MATKYGVSRSPIREAFIRLSSDGLINTLPNKNTLVAPIDIEGFPQYIDALDLIQRAITRLAAILRSSEDIENIIAKNEIFKKAVRLHDALAMIDANREFHLAISQAAHNKHFTFIYQRLLDEGRRTLRVYYQSYNDTPPSKMVDTHELMIKAIIDKDADLAEKLAHEHSTKLSDSFIRHLSKRFTSEISVNTSP